MTTYDAPDGTNGPRSGAPGGPRRADAFRSGRPDFIDGEVVAVEVHDHPSATPTPGPAAARRRAEYGDHASTEPTGPDSAGLQDSLDQIERLAAELKEIAEVITPTPGSTGRRPAGPAAGPSGGSGPARPPSVGQPTVPVRPDEARAAGRATAPPTGHRVNAAQTTGTAQNTGPQRPAGPRFGPHNTPPSAATRPTATPAASTGTTAPSAEPRKDDDVLGWLGPDAPRTKRPRTMGTSVIKEPLPPEPKRQGNPDLVFGTEPARPANTTTTSANTAATAGTATAGSCTANATTTANATVAANATTAKATEAKAGTAKATTAKAGTTANATTAARVAGTARPARTDPLPKLAPAADNPTTQPRAEKVVLTATTAMPSVFSAGPSKPAETTEALRTTAPPSRTSRKDQRRPAGRSKAPRGRYTAMAIGAFVLAVPAFALGAVQPWNTSAKSEDKVSVATGDRASAPPYTGGDPSAAIPNPSPTPSVATVLPITPREVTSGEAGEQPKRPVGPPPKSVPPTHRNSHPVGLALSVYANNVKPNVGESVRFKLTWKDGSGNFAGTAQQWGDGSPAGGSIDIKKCTGDAPPSSGATEVTHTFREAGTFRVKLSVTTYTCDGRTETQTVPMTVTVKEVPGTPTPSPTQSSPTPSPTPSPKTDD
jgi:hypothetical protein